MDQIAQLISAAPDLYESCKDMLKRATQVAERSGITAGDPFWQFIIEATNAVHKAEGNLDADNGSVSP